MMYHASCWFTHYWIYPHQWKELTDRIVPRHTGYMLRWRHRQYIPGTFLGPERQGKPGVGDRDGVFRGVACMAGSEVEKYLTVPSWVSEVCWWRLPVSIINYPGAFTVMLTMIRRSSPFGVSCSTSLCFYWLLLREWRNVTAITRRKADIMSALYNRRINYVSYRQKCMLKLAPEQPLHVANATNALTVHWRIKRKTFNSFRRIAGNH